MPFYDYECSDSHRFELKQPFSAATVAVCPTCKKPARRLINLVPVHFKGSGFYVTDYGRRDSDGSESSKKSAESNGTAAKTPDASKGTEAPKESAATPETK